MGPEPRTSAIRLVKAQPARSLGIPPLREAHEVELPRLVLPRERAQEPAGLAHGRVGVVAVGVGDEHAERGAEVAHGVHGVAPRGPADAQGGQELDGALHEVELAQPLGRASRHVQAEAHVLPGQLVKPR